MTDINVKAVCVIPSISFNPLDRQLKLPCGTHSFSGFKNCSSSPRSLKELFAGSLGADGCLVCSRFPMTRCF